MRRVLFASLLLGLPVALTAQLPVRVNRRGGGAELATGEPVSFYLEHSRELELTDGQKTQLMEIRRRLRAVNAPWVKQLDSLREVVGLSLEPTQGGRDSQREAMERFNKLSAPIADSMRVNNDAARNEVWALLSEPQRTKADSVAKADGDARRRPPTGRRPPG